MKVGTHYNMAKIAISRLQNSQEDKLCLGIRAKLFCIGTVLPDLSINQFIHRHFYPLSGEYIKKKIQRLVESGRRGPIQALKTGAIVHYLSDFCCAVHVSGGVGNVREHLQYERDIHRYVLAQLADWSTGFSQAGSTGLLHETVFEQVRSYHSRSEHGLATDLQSCVEICELVYAYLFQREAAVAAAPVLAAIGQEV